MGVEEAVVVAGEMAAEGAEEVEIINITPISILCDSRMEKISRCTLLFILTLARGINYLMKPRRDSSANEPTTKEIG